MEKNERQHSGQGLPAPICSETEIALLRAMRWNRSLITEYQRWPATVQMLKQEIAAAAEAFADNDEERMKRLTYRMNANLHAVGSQNTEVVATAAEDATSD